MMHGPACLFATHSVFRDQEDLLLVEVTIKNPTCHYTGFLVLTSPSTWPYLVPGPPLSCGINCPPLIISLPSNYCNVWCFSLHAISPTALSWPQWPSLTLSTFFQLIKAIQRLCLEPLMSSCTCGSPVQTCPFPCWFWFVLHNGCWCWVCFLCSLITHILSTQIILAFQIVFSLLLLNVRFSHCSHWSLPKCWP